MLARSFESISTGVSSSNCRTRLPVVGLKVAIRLGLICRVLMPKHLAASLTQLEETSRLPLVGRFWNGSCLGRSPSLFEPVPAAGDELFTRLAVFFHSTRHLFL